MGHQNYDVMMRTAIGARYGTMSVTIENSKINGILMILKKSNPFSGDIDENGDCQIKGEFKTLLRTIPYNATGRITEDNMVLHLKCEHEIFDLSGTACAHVPNAKKEKSV